MGQTKNVTVSSVAGEGDFSFTTLEPVKSAYAEGEVVYVKYTVKNNGAVSSGAEIIVKDRDTGSQVTGYTVAEMPPGYSFATSGSHARVGKMPNKDWKLSFTVTP